MCTTTTRHTVFGGSCTRAADPAAPAALAPLASVSICAANVLATTHRRVAARSGATCASKREASLQLAASEGLRWSASTCVCVPSQQLSNAGGSCRDAAGGIQGP